MKIVLKKPRKVTRFAFKNKIYGRMVITIEELAAFADKEVVGVLEITEAHNKEVN